MLASTLLATLAFAPRVGVSSADALRFERGRLPADVGRSFESRVDPRVALVVSLFSHSRVEVRCWSPEDWQRRTSALTRRTGLERLGAWRAFTTSDRRAIELSPQVCTGLTMLADEHYAIGSGAWADALAWSLAALAHEAQHASGVWNEARADCYGMQSIPIAARVLGRTAAEGRYLATVYWKHWHVWHGPRYHSRECRNGGRLDLYPGSHVWP